MKCSLLTLSCALDGELSRERQSELEAHLVTCERCRTGMRYLRDETDRISQLARVEVSGTTATALLERARVVVTPSESVEPETKQPPDPSDEGKESAVDPFNLMGIGTEAVAAGELLDAAPSEHATEIPVEPPAAEQMAEEPGEPQVPIADDLAEPAPEPVLLPPGAFSYAPVPPADQYHSPGAENAEGEAAATAEGSLGEAETNPEAGDDDASLPMAAAIAETELDKPPADGDAMAAPAGDGTSEPTAAQAADPDPEVQGGDEDRPSAELGVVDGTRPPDDPQPPSGGAPADAPMAPGTTGEADLLDGEPEPWSSDRDGWNAAPDRSAQLEGTPDTLGPLPSPTDPPEVLAGNEPATTVWPADSGPEQPIEVGDGPPPLFVPLRFDAGDDPPHTPRPSAWPPNLVATGDTPMDAAPPPPPPSSHQSDEVMQVALEESALLGELSQLDRLAADPRPPGPAPAEPSIPPPPSITSRSGNLGWEPSSSLNLGLDQLPAAALDAGDTEPKPTQRPWKMDRVEASAVLGSGAATRPKDSVVPPSEPSAPGRLQSGRQAAIPPRRRRVPTEESQGGAPPRSWTKTATIAIAALAVFLIGWSLLHHSSTPAPKPTAHHHAILPTQSKPTPTQQPTASTQPAVTLTDTQSFGGTGSGYQVQNVRYGLHQNNTQLWVVFQLIQGTGAPKVTTGFSGATDLYLEMSGVAPGAAVAQPAPGGLVTKVTPTQVPGFSGAAYLLQLSRATKIDSAYLLPGSETSSAGERVVLELQN